LRAKIERRLIRPPTARPKRIACSTRRGWTRQNAGSAMSTGGSLRVRRGAEAVERARENLAPREELRVRLDADDDFPRHVATSSPAAAAGSCRAVESSGSK
jgi:hypothetical protein